LNRIDEIITFNSLTKEDLMLIVDLEITHFQTSLSESELTINLSEGAKLLLVEKGFDKNLGARPLKRTIARELEDLIIDHLIDVDEPKSSLDIDVSDEHLFIK
jgi:ATP-dependent Clp protease ATP-binding subunit ClpA